MPPSTRPSTIAYFKEKLTEAKGRLNSSIGTFRRCLNNSDCQEFAGIFLQQIIRRRSSLRSIVTSHKIPLLCIQRGPRLAVSWSTPDFSLRCRPSFIPQYHDEKISNDLVRKFNPVERDFRNQSWTRWRRASFPIRAREVHEAAIAPISRRKYAGSQRRTVTALATTSCPSMKRAKNDSLRVKTTVGADTTPFYITRNAASLFLGTARSISFVSRL